jgi:hypothetical protein
MQHPLRALWVRRLQLSAPLEEKRMDKAPEVFDWVTARAGCSAPQMFILLTERPESDVRAMQVRLGSGYQIKVNKVSDDKFIVSKLHNEGGFAFGGHAVVVERTTSGIVAQLTNSQRTKQPFFAAQASLGPDGRCRYEVSGEEMELWQVSRKALEDLFFQ